MTVNSSHIFVNISFKIFVQKDNLLSMNKNIIKIKPFQI